MKTPRNHRLQGNLEEIIHAGQRATKIIGQLMSFSRGDSAARLKPMDGTLALLDSLHSELMDQTKANEMGVTTYIMKPMPISELVECVKTVLD